MPLLLYPWERDTINHCTGGWKSLGADLNEYRKSHTHHSSNPIPLSPSDMLY